jgi:hypothetical protein
MLQLLLYTDVHAMRTGICIELVYIRIAYTIYLLLMQLLLLLQCEPACASASSRLWLHTSQALCAVH